MNSNHFVKTSDPELFTVIQEYFSEDDGFLKTVKAIEIYSVGCIVNVTTKHSDNISEAVCFVPGVKIAKDREGYYKLISM